MYIPSVQTKIENLNITVYGKIEPKFNQGTSLMKYALKITSCVHSKQAHMHACHKIAIA